MDMKASIDCSGSLSAVLIKANGTRQDCGVIATDDLTKALGKFTRLFNYLKKNFGMTAAMLFIAGMVKSGHLSPLALPMMGIVTTVGVNYMASDFASGGVTPTISGFKFHMSGVGTGGAVVGDTVSTFTAPTPDPGRTSGTPTNPSANVYKTVATIAYTGNNAITEWGLASAAAAGTLWDRRTFSAINVASGDSIQFSYSLTVNNGGT